MRDFTLKIYQVLLETILNSNFRFQTLEAYLERPQPDAFLLRHDVDKNPAHSLLTAQLEFELGIQGSYYFRVVSESFDANCIQRIVELKHEVGYHYEDVRLAAKKIYRGHQLASAKGSLSDLLLPTAVELFEQHLQQLRQFYPVKTICMHGNPLSKYDNRILWEKYDFRDFGIIGEPYFNTEFNDVLYLTDTGRCWNGQQVNIRDRITAKPQSIFSLKKNQPKKTMDIIELINGGKLTEKIMLTVHPQRWHNAHFPWLRELVWQNIKNVGKWLLLKIRKT